MSSNTEQLNYLAKIGLVQTTSDYASLGALLQTGQAVFYCGFDPTADSLHIGHLLAVVTMGRLQKFGHTPLALIGTATGMIGDPSGKSAERNLVPDEQIDFNASCLEKQLRVLLPTRGANSVTVVRNGDWLKKISLIDFLRDIGKLFSVNTMLGRDSVKTRIESREHGISFTEFSYMLLQAYDFYWLYKNYNCRLQIGGSDQWGNIAGGIDLIHRLIPGTANQIHGLTFPLLTTSSGQKFGKTEKGAVWLDPAKTSPYLFYQYWVNTADSDVLRLLKLFTEADASIIADLEKATREEPEKRLAQIYLANAITELVHGQEERILAEQASLALFGGAVRTLSASCLLQIFSEVPSSHIPAEDFSTGISALDLVARTNLAASRSQARKLIESGGFYINNERVTSPEERCSLSRLIDNSVLLLRSGKKTYHLVKTH